MLLFKKYIIKEILLYFIIINFVLFFISIANTYVGLLTKMAGGKLSFNLAAKIIALHIPESFSLLVPVSMFIATLFVISKLYASNEIIVLFISGLSWKFLITTITLISIVVAAITAGISLYITPIAIQKRENLLRKNEALGFVNLINPGAFQVANNDKQIFYVGEVNKNQIQDIFIITNTEHKTAPLIITAKEGTIETLKEQEGALLILKNGHRYSGILGDSNFSIVDFTEYGRKLLPTNKPPSGSHYKAKASKQLVYSADCGDLAEFQWRVAMPISVLILNVLAIGLAKVSPRQGRFAKFLPAILLYIIYFNAMVFMQRLLAAGEISKIYGIWVIHIIFLILAIMLLLDASGWLFYFRKKYFKYENYH